jgi:hypothetical protein
MPSLATMLKMLLRGWQINNYAQYYHFDYGGNEIIQRDDCMIILVKEQNK